MARYLDAEELKSVIKANDWSNPVVPNVVNLIIDRTPAADVVPRSDIESIFTFAETALKDAKNVCERNFAKAAQGGMADVEKAIGRREQTELFERMLKRYKELYFAGRERKEQP